jgi:hypothetical protein
MVMRLHPGAGVSSYGRETSDDRDNNFPGTPAKPDLR